jgi:hypothetical protein
MHSNRYVHEEGGFQETGIYREPIEASRKCLSMQTCVNKNFAVVFNNILRNIILLLYVTGIFFR